MPQVGPQPLQPGLAAHTGLESFWLCWDTLEDEDPSRGGAWGRRPRSPTGGRVASTGTGSKAQDCQDV